MIALRCIAPDGEFKTEGKFKSIEAAWQRSQDMGSRWFFYPIHVVTAARKILAVPDGVPETWVGRWLDTFIRALKWEQSNNEQWYNSWIEGESPCPLKDPDAYTRNEHPPILPGLRPAEAVARSTEKVDATWLFTVRAFLVVIAGHQTYGDGEGELDPGSNDNFEDCVRVMNGHIRKARELAAGILPPDCNLPSSCRLAMQLGSSSNVFSYMADVLEHGNHHKLAEWMRSIEDLLRAGVDLKLTIPHAPWRCPDCSKLLKMDDQSVGHCEPCGTSIPLHKLRYDRDS